MSESSGSDDEFDADDVYSMDLYDWSATGAEILDKIREHPTFVSFRSHAENKWTVLSVEQIEATLDLNIVDWEDFHTKVLESIVWNKGTNKTNAHRKATAYMNACAELKVSISRSNLPDFAKIIEHHSNEWSSAVYTFACLFIEELERSVNKTIDDLSTKIDSILATPFEPLDEIHAETIYYIVCASLEAADRWRIRGQLRPWKVL